MSGGRPPRDNSRRGERAVRAGLFVQEVARALMLVALFSLNIRNAENVIIKYVSSVKIVREGENCRTITIQPRCAMEEYARILRSWVWLSPPQPPTMVEVSPRIIKRVVLVHGVWINRANGASFCQVDKISPVVRSRP